MKNRKNMKQLKLIFIAAFTFLTIPCSGAQTTGIIIQEIITTGMTERVALNYVADQQAYTNGIGGITFSYPVGWFNQPPFVQISIIQNAGHPTTQAYVAEVSANSTTSTTVMVYLVNSGVVNEAATSSVTVALWAVDDPI
jgi:hypothetical protein